MHNQAVAEQRVISEKVHRVNNDANVRSLGHLQTRRKRKAQSSKCKLQHMSLTLFQIREAGGGVVHEITKRPSDVPRISARVSGTHHKARKRKNEKEKSSTCVRPEETEHLMEPWVRTRQATKLSHRVAHSQTWCFRDSPQRAVAFSTELHKCGREQ